MKTNVLIWGLFVRSSMKSAIHLGPLFSEILKVWKNTNFEEIQNLFNITQKLILERIVGNRWRTDWIRVTYLPRIPVIADSSGYPKCFYKIAEHWTWEIHRSDHLHVHVQRYWLNKKRKRWRNSRRDTGRLSALETKRDGMELAIIKFKETGHPVFTSASALSRKRNCALQCECFEHKTLLPNHSLSKSAQNQRSSLKLVWRVRSVQGRMRETQPRKSSQQKKTPWTKKY